MPKVPFQGVSDQPLRPLPQNRQSAEGANALAFGGGQAAGLQAIGAGLGQVADDAQKIALDIQLRDAERAARDGMTALSQGYRDILYGENGYFGLNGQNAVDAQDSTAKRLTDLRDSIGKNMSEQSRRLFDASSIAQTNNHLDAMASHAVKERDAADVASWTSQADEAMNLAAADPYSADVLYESRNTVRSMAQKLGQFKGDKPETIQNSMDAADTTLLVGAMNSIIERDNVAKATEFYNANKESINGKDRIAIEKHLGTAAKAERVDLEHQLTVAKQLADAEEQDNYDTLIDAVLSGDATAKDVIQSPVKGSHKTAAYNLMVAITKAGGQQNMRTDNATYIALLERIHLPDGDRQKLTNKDDLLQFVFRGLLAPSGDNSIVSLRAEIDGGRSQGDDRVRNEAWVGINAAASELILPHGGMAKYDTRGNTNLLRWRAEARQIFDDGIAAGIPVSKLSNPDDPEYAGRTIKNYMRTPAQVASDIREDQLGSGASGVIAPPAVEEAAPFAPPPAGNVGPRGGARPAGLTTREGILAARKAGTIDRAKAEELLAKIRAQ